MAALRPLLVLGLAAAFILADPAPRAAAQEGDVFSTNTDEAPPQQGGDPMRCFDHALRNAKAAVQAYQVVYGDPWEEDGRCPQSGGGAPAGLGACWGDLGPARGLLEQAAELLETGRKTQGPQGKEMIKQGNALVRKAKALVDEAGRCFMPLFAQWRKNGGDKKQQQPGDETAANTPGDGSGLLLKGGVEMNEGEPPPDEPCSSPENPGLDAQLMAAAQDLDHMVDSATKYSIAATDRFFTVMSETVEIRLKEVSNAAADPGAAATQTVDAVVDYLSTDYNTNNERMYEAAVAAVEEIQQDPAAFFAKFAVDQAASAGTGAIGGGVTACVRKAKSAADAALKAQAVARAQRAAERLQAMQKKSGRFGAMVEDASSAPPRKSGFDNESGAYGQNPHGNNNPFAPDEHPPMQTPSAEMVFCEGLDNQCFKVALAQAETWDSGVPHVPTPTGLPGATLPMSGEPEIMNALRKKYGGRPIEGFSAERQSLQDIGWGLDMPSKQGIIDDLKAAGGDAQGIVFVKQFEGGDGHVFNVGKFGDRIVWKDMTGRMEHVFDLEGNLISAIGQDPTFLLSGQPWSISLFRVR